MKGEVLAGLVLLVLLALLLLVLIFTRPYDPYYGYEVTKRPYGRGFDLRVKKKIQG